jgi:hypothetical protein
MPVNDGWEVREEGELPKGGLYCPPVIPAEFRYFSEVGYPYKWLVD